MTNEVGFWSYVHADDEADSGRVVDLAHDIVGQYEMLTGDSVDLFLDRDSIGWGQAWEARVDGALASVAFFVPVVTPRYFRSAACRHELQTFASRAQAAGIRDLILPLLYVDFPEFGKTREEQDELVTLIKGLQWKNWTQLRFADRTSRDYRTAVSELAARLVEVNMTAETTILPPAAPEENEVDEPGFLDLVAFAEMQMPNLIETLNSANATILEVAAATQAAAEEIDQSDGRNAGMAGRLTAAKKLAITLTPLGNDILYLGNDFSHHLHDIDLGMRALVERVAAEIADDPSSIDVACAFAASLRGLGENADTGLGALKELVSQITPVEQVSRDLRKPLRVMKDGLTRMIDGNAVIQNWAALMDEIGLDCDSIITAGG